MSNEMELVRQINNRNAAKTEAEKAKFQERIEAYAHYPFYPLYEGDENSDELSTTDIVEELRGDKKQARVKELADNNARTAAKGKKK